MTQKTQGNSHNYLIHKVLFIDKFWFVLVRENAYQIIIFTQQPSAVTWLSSAVTGVAGYGP